MNDKAFEKMMAQKQKEASKSGYGARCAAKAREVNKTRKGSLQELILS
jgi:hypothetical protein